MLLGNSPNACFRCKVWILGKEFSQPYFVFNIEKILKKRGKNLKKSTRQESFNKVIVLHVFIEAQVCSCISQDCLRWKGPRQIIKSDS